MSIPPAPPKKAALRTLALARRDALDGARRAAAAEAIVARGLPVAIRPGMVIAGYSPIRSELDPIPLMRALATRGARLALPVIAARDLPLVFRAWSPGDPLARGLFGILEPLPQAGEIIPDIVLVPLAAFDRLGHRIGYGAGHYDRSLAALRAARTIVAIGVAFAAQEIAAVPMQPHDVAMDYVLTETQAFDFRSS